MNTDDRRIDSKGRLTIPAIVAWESYKAVGRSQKRRVQRAPADNFDRIVEFTDETGLEAAALDESLSAQGIALDTANLLIGRQFTTSDCSTKNIRFSGRSSDGVDRTHGR